MDNAENLHFNTISVTTSSNTRAGGRTMSFNAIVVAGNGNNLIGCARAKASSAALAVQKAKTKASKSMFKVFLGKNTILYPLDIKYKSTKIVLLPAAEGTGIVTNAKIRMIFQVLRATNVLGKVYGSRNPLNVAFGVIEALKNMKPTSYFINKRQLHT